MVTQQIKKLKKASGFTIVELLIVIVVIAILAAIAYVSYTGVTQNASTTKARVNAKSVQTVADTYFSSEQSYPTAVEDFTTGDTATLPASVNLLTGSEDADDLDASNGDSTIWYQYCAGGSTGPAIKVVYFNFSTGAPVSGSDIIYSGDSACTGGTWTNPTAPA